MTTCDGCLWNEQCGREVSCEYYSPLFFDEEAYIESAKIEFLAEWDELEEELR